MSLLRRAILACATASVLATPAPAQGVRLPQVVVQPADSAQTPAVARPDTAPAPITPSQIPVEADRTVFRAFELSAAGRDAEQDEILVAARRLADSISTEDRISDLAAAHLLTRRGLGDLSLTWQTRSRQVQDWRRQLQHGARQIDSARVELLALAGPWQRTAATQDSLDEVLRQRIAQVRDELKRVDSALTARGRVLVDGELALSATSSVIFQELQSAGEASEQMRQDLLRIESPPLWRSPFAAGSMSAESRGGFLSALPELTWFARGNATRLAAHVLLTVLALLLVLLSRDRVRAAAARHAKEREPYAILNRPLAAIVLVSLSLVMWLYPRAPLGVYDLALMLSALPLLLLVPHLMSPDMHATARSALGLLLLQRVSTVVTIGTPSYRLVQLFLSIAGAALLWYALRPGRALAVTAPTWRLWLNRLAWALFAGFVVAVASNVIGNVSLADTINAGIALSLYLGILFHAVTQVIDVFATVVIRAGARDSRYLAARGDRVERVVATAVDLVALLAWAVLTLQGFLLWVPVQQAIAQLVRESFHVGKVTISLGVVALFLVVLLGGTMLSRLIAGVLELDVMGRMDLRRGVAVTVGSLLRYALIAVAFLVALASVGIGLGNIAILGGALGVGIGFGLQNIVNNFISGLLLAFERPIGIGDTVQVGTNTGEVKEIGIRASIIRTVEGADVIVPNSELITKDVVNWTRTGTRRRFEIAVGVAYGSDPAKVIGLLADAALQHPDVRGSPKPFALFTGFGASSLDFVVRAWTDAVEWGVVRSDVAVAIHAALREAGIEIPFPQQDLHLRTVHAEAVRDLRGEATGA